MFSAILNYFYTNIHQLYLLLLAAALLLHAEGTNRGDAARLLVLLLFDEVASVRGWSCSNERDTSPAFAISTFSLPALVMQRLVDMKADYILLHFYGFFYLVTCSLLVGICNNVAETIPLYFHSV